MGFHLRNTFILFLLVTLISLTTTSAVKLSGDTPLQDGPDISKVPAEIYTSNRFFGKIKEQAEAAIQNVQATVQKVVPVGISTNVDKATDSACRSTSNIGVCKRIVKALASLVPGALRRKRGTPLTRFLKCSIPLVISSGEQTIDQVKALRPLSEKVIRCVQKVDVLTIMHTMARNRGDPTPAARKLNVCMHEVRREAHKLGRLGYNTITIGFTAGVGSRVSEWGVAFDLRRNPQKVRGYITSRSSSGRIGAGAGVVVGFAKVANNALGGKGKGVALSGGAGVLSGGIALDFLGKKKFTRASFTAKTGLRSPVRATCSRTVTVQF